MDETQIPKIFREYLWRVVIDKFPNLLAVLAFVSLLSSFISYKGKQWTFPTQQPNWFFVGLTALLFLLTVIVFFKSRIIKKLKDKTKIEFSQVSLIIRIGNLQDADINGEDTAFVLPVNTTFTDECITDTKSVLGSFFNKHHSSKILNFNTQLQEILAENHISPLSSGRYELSTIIILPDKYSIPAKLILVASTEKCTGKGFYTTPSTIDNCVHNVFQETADKRIANLCFPIIGSGHGGMGKTEALNLLVLCIKFYAKQFNHVKNVFIFIREIDSKEINASFLNSLKQ
ncbi:macro domain-containing protein [candidate division WOR-3 bacterium]|nr:macro domain-containing protein [candidate division WOR-3 bacterium]